MAEATQFSNILLGVGSSAYQIEGGWNSDGKSPSIQDDFFHNLKLTEDSLPSKKVEQKPPKAKIAIFHKGVNIYKTKTPDPVYINGDIACDSYNKVDEDIKNLIDLGVDVYRFSICWPRILPRGDSRYPNEAGVKHYDNFIQKLIDNNIQPLVTMYHWDLPSALQNIGGWSNPLIVQYFSDYATFLFKTYGQKVKLWSTINEPGIYSMGHGSSFMAPGSGEDFGGVGDYAACRNLLLAHAAAYKIYKNSFKAEQKGEISIAIDASAYFPHDLNSEADRQACLRGVDNAMGVFIQPLVNGEYPKSFLDSIEKTNKSIQFPIQRIIPFTDEEKKDLIGSYDFLAFNYYNAVTVRAMTEEEYANETNLKYKDMGYILHENTEVEANTFKGFTEVIDWFGKMCGNPTLFITENGLSGKYDNDDQEKKVNYHRGILSELNKAIVKGVQIKGYTMWSFMDSLEWSNGYNKVLFGIYSVDFTNPKRPRSKKACFEFFQQLFKTKTLPSIKQK